MTRSHVSRIIESVRVVPLNESNGIIQYNISREFTLVS